MNLFRHVALGAQKALNATPLLDLFEAVSLIGVDDRPPPPIFILGCPRSGTTIFYELLTAHWQTAYISNLASLLHRAPSLTSRLAFPLLGRPQPVYRSNVGFIPGMMAPSEAGRLTRRWFMDDDSQVARGKTRLLRRQCKALSAAFGGPLVYKNLYVDATFDRVLAVFPEAIVIRIHRDPRFVAQSILDVRRRELGDEGQWWGPKPPGWEGILQSDAIRQVAWQIGELERRLDGISALPALGGRVIDVDYSVLCQDTVATVTGALARYAGLSGVVVTPVSAMPASLSASEKVKMKAERWQALEQALRECKVLDPS